MLQIIQYNQYKIYPNGFLKTVSESISWLCWNTFGSKFLAANFGQKILHQYNFGLNFGVKNCDMDFFLHFIFAQVSITVFVLETSFIRKLLLSRINRIYFWGSFTNIFTLQLLIKPKWNKSLRLIKFLFKSQAWLNCKR